MRLFRLTQTVNEKGIFTEATVVAYNGTEAGYFHPAGYGGGWWNRPEYCDEWCPPEQVRVMDLGEITTTALGAPGLVAVKRAADRYERAEA